MKVMVYKRQKGAGHVLILPAPADRLPPVLLGEVTREDLRSRVAPVVASLEAARLARRGPSG